jgi:hypothetical protein
MTETTEISNFDIVICLVFVICYLIFTARPG